MQGVKPLHPEPGDIGSIDPRQRAEPLFIVTASMAQPVTWLLVGRTLQAQPFKVRSTLKLANYDNLSWVSEIGSSINHRIGKKSGKKVRWWRILKWKFSKPDVSSGRSHPFDISHRLADSERDIDSHGDLPVYCPPWTKSPLCE